MAAGNWTQLKRKRTLRVVGLMSGTSADGIDAALVDLAGRDVTVLAFATYPYPPALRRAVLALCDPATATTVSERWTEYFPDGGVEMGDSAKGHLD